MIHDAGPSRADEARRRLLIEHLRPRLGAKLLAYMLRRDATAALREPAAGEQLVDDLARLDLIRKVLDTLGEPDAVARAWLTGMNSNLDDVGPARLLRSCEVHSVADPLLAAAASHHR